MFAKSLYYDQSEYLLTEADILLEDRCLLKHAVQKSVLSLDLLVYGDIRYYEELRQVNKIIKGAKFESLVEDLRYYIDQELIDLQVKYAKIRSSYDEPIERVLWESRFDRVVGELKLLNITMVSELIDYPLENLLEKRVGFGTAKLVVHEIKNWLERQLKFASGEIQPVSEGTVNKLIAEFFGREQEVE